MDTHALTVAATDPSLAALGFVPFVEEALKTGDPWFRTYAIEAFVLKVIRGDLQAWEELRACLTEETEKKTERLYLFNVARLGNLFINNAFPNRDAECAKVVLWLINNDPSDPFLENPYCYDFTGESYESVNREWLRVVNERPNEIRVLANAAECLREGHPEVTESLLVRCRLLDPNNPIWIQRITELGSP
jgi:hypothetical protein